MGIHASSVLCEARELVHKLKFILPDIPWVVRLTSLFFCTINYRFQKELLFRARSRQAYLNRKLQIRLAHHSTNPLRIFLDDTNCLSPIRGLRRF